MFYDSKNLQLRGQRSGSAVVLLLFVYLLVVLFAQSSDLSFIPGTRMVEGENQLL